MIKIIKIITRFSVSVHKSHVMVDNHILIIIPKNVFFQLMYSIFFFFSPLSQYRCQPHTSIISWALAYSIHNFHIKHRQ